MSSLVTVVAPYSTRQLLVGHPSPSADTLALVSVPVGMTRTRPTPATQTANPALLALSLWPSPVCAASPRCPTSHVTSLSHPVARLVAGVWIAVFTSASSPVTLANVQVSPVPSHALDPARAVDIDVD